MKPVLIVYATREGHTHNVATRFAESLAGRDFPSVPTTAGDALGAIDLSEHSGVILTASVQTGRHELAMVEFAKTHREALADMPAALLSLSLLGNGDVAPSTAADRAQAAVHIQLDRFFTESAWGNDQARPLSGAVMSSKHGWLVKWRTRRMAESSSSAPHDHDYTDWQPLDQFVDQFVAKELSPTLRFRTI